MLAPPIGVDEEAMDDEIEEPASRRIHWTGIDDWLDTLGDAEALALGDDGETLVSDEARLELPAVLCGRISAEAPLASLREALAEPLPLQLVVLMQAGAVSLGLFDEGTALETRTLKKYTVRGHGKAQSTHLKRRGKSRYGSRLRLQNAENLLRQSHAKLRAWMDVYGPPEGLFYAAPIRLWSDAFHPRLDPALDADAGWVRIRRDLPVPTTELLLRVYSDLCHGRVVVDGVR